MYLSKETKKINENMMNMACMKVEIISWEGFNTNKSKPPERIVPNVKKVIPFSSAKMPLFKL